MNTRSPEHEPALTMRAIREAHVRIRDKIHRTPVMTSGVLDEMAGNRLYFKCENLQKVGAFKARGATNAVFLLSDAEAAKGVVTHSSGNHAAALARAARLRGIPAFIVMPSNSPQAKQAAVRRYGGEIVLCEPTLAARESTARQVMERTGAAFIHPYNDLRVMAGQGTTAIELLEDVPDLDVILCPVGGGGQLSGIAVAAKDLRPGIRVLGVEPAGADDAARSLRAGRIIPMLEPRTIADGLKTSLGERPFAEILRLVEDIVTVREESIVQAMRRIWEVMKLIVEASGAVSYAAIVDGKISASGARVGIILSGGNLDLDRLPWQ
ncbi:MAG TPA: pyridoxal-phosphate dependent enzyme [Steroidobacteraceae bacterium]|jgi:threonine dehydratase|nr:pyridoxal-phosphate dependent enzyme [Steroidobacteraceae bacterium]